MASSTSLGAVSEFFYGDTLEAVRAAHAAETAHATHGEHSVQDGSHGEVSHEDSEWANVQVELGEHGNQGEHEDQGAHHRRLGGGTSPLLRNIAFCLTTCGLVAFFVGLCKQLSYKRLVFGEFWEPHNRLHIIEIHIGEIYQHSHVRSFWRCFFFSFRCSKFSIFIVT